MTTTRTPERNHPVTTAPARPTLYGPDGQALASAPEPTPEAAVDTGDWRPVRQDSVATVWERPRLEAAPDPVVDDAREQADRIVADAHAEADRITAEARSLRARTLGSADHDARTIREQAAAETARQQKRAANLDTWMARAVIAGAVGLTATGEYSLARLAHFPGQVAWLLPFVIDIYVIQAFRRHRDILQAIGLTIAANVVYHLAAAGMFGVTTDARGAHHATWWLIAMVASVASVILWRMHVITAPPREKKRHRGDSAGEPEMAVPQAPAETPAVAVEAPADGSAEASVSGSAAVPNSGSPTLTVVPSPAETDSPSDDSAVAVTAPTANRRGSGSDQRNSRRDSAPRGSATPASGGSGSDQQVAALVTLMRRRGSADAVTLADAKKACPGVSERTAARRLETARTQYSKTAK